MSPVICRECGTSFAADAFVCPHCKAWRGEAGTGAHPSHEPANRVLQALAIVLMALTLCATVGLMLLWNSTPLPAARPPETSRPGPDDAGNQAMDPERVELAASTAAPAGPEFSAPRPSTAPGAATPARP